jgi:hypothetical protein
MSRRRHTPDQIIRKLAEGHKLLAAGTGLDAVCRDLEVPEPSRRARRACASSVRETTRKYGRKPPSSSASGQVASRKATMAMSS